MFYIVRSIYTSGGAVMVAAVASQLAVAMISAGGSELALSGSGAWRHDCGVEIDQFWGADDTVWIVAHDARRA